MFTFKHRMMSRVNYNLLYKIYKWLLVGRHLLRWYSPSKRNAVDLSISLRTLNQEGVERSFQTLHQTSSPAIHIYSYSYNFAINLTNAFPQDESSPSSNVLCPARANPSPPELSSFNSSVVLLSQACTDGFVVHEANKYF